MPCETAQAAHQPRRDGHRQHDGHEHRGEASRRGELPVELEPRPDPAAAVRRQPDAGDHSRQRTYLHDEALPPAVPDGQRQHQADYKVDSVQKQRVSRVKILLLAEPPKKRKTRTSREPQIPNPIY